MISDWDKCIGLEVSLATAQAASSHPPTLATAANGGLHQTICLFLWSMMQRHLIWHWHYWSQGNAVAAALHPLTCRYQHSVVS